MNLLFEKYSSELAAKWDDFVMNKSINGTFLQSRQFLNYHQADKFEDASIIIMNGSNIVAVIPACQIISDEKKTFYSHLGSTFGGIILNQTAYSVSYLEEIMLSLDKYLRYEKYEHVIMKSTSDLFCKTSMAFLDYEYFRYGYSQYNEVSFYLKCCEISDDGLSMMTASRRRDYKYSLKHNFKIQKIETDELVSVFYGILKENLKKFDAKPVHSLHELLDLKNHRLKDIVRFYGVFDDKKMIAGSMLFAFDHSVLHTQYLACLPEYNKKFAMNFMDYNLIMIAKNENFKYFSFGTSTTNHGKDLNTGLALYKEGFGCSYSVNRTYYKDL